MTLRALRTLRECDAIFCEDTRVTAKLLARYEIRKPVHRFDQHAQKKTSGFFFDLLHDGKHLVLVTDAGTPGVSDPGNLIVARVAAEIPEVRIESIPGPSALTALASIAGMPTDRFLFLGFLPLKKRRRAVLGRIASSDVTVFFYESPHRIVRTLRELAPLLGDRTVVLGRELTKLHETIYRGTAASIAGKLEAGMVKGEIVVGIAGV
ncbi:16S rRNA (cytidine(1402)-2'-O)-methyltransferase [Candidatus Uhrbacteria bacterium]|nr:16S rRNA (cytidine(1402)-2'-O)-methyltransferase [Candidatus Uhrbacteria bacterium]